MFDVRSSEEILKGHHRRRIIKIFDRSVPVLMGRTCVLVRKSCRMDLDFERFVHVARPK